MIVDDIKVIDVDTHIIEPYDLWTSRLSSAKYGDKIPAVRWDEEKQQDSWYFGSHYVGPAAAAAMAGLDNIPPNWPSKLGEVKEYTWSADARLAEMDRNGIYAQILYPNTGGFGGGSYLSLNDGDLMLDCVKAYNDWVIEWASAAPKRLVPMMALPFWDIDASVHEMARAAKLGHKGVVACSEPDFFGQPKLSNPHWDRLWAAAQDMGLPINFHIGSGSDSAFSMFDPSIGGQATYAGLSVQFFLGNSSALLQVICGGICHRFPKLNFVSVESGIGWLPFFLQSMDWQWRNAAVRKERPEYDLLPSEYFKRQMYGCFWFEREGIAETLRAVGDDNLMFETDFPHPTSMSPGPASIAQPPRQYIEDVLGNIPAQSRTKLLHDNAAKLYDLN